MAELDKVTVEEEVSILEVVEEALDLDAEDAEVHTLEVTTESSEAVETEEETQIITVFDENDFTVDNQRDSGSLSVEQEERIIIVEEVGVEIVETAEQGPPGIPGPKGDKGDKGDPGEQGPKGDSSTLNVQYITEEFTIEAKPVPVLTLSQVPVMNSLGIYINGLIQYPNDYELDGSNVTILPSALPEIGDSLIFRYYYVEV